ncbi:MAG: hypothetical protein ABIL20_09155 [candidate division WOR-3 bacterium]
MNKTKILLLLSSIFFLSCTLVSLSGSGIDKTVSLTGRVDSKDYEVIRHNARWTKTVDANELSNFDIREAILDLLAETKGDAVINLKFTVRQSFVQGFIEILLLGLYSPHTAIVECDIVKYK